MTSFDTIATITLTNKKGQIMKRILVSGASGNLGRAVVTAAKSKGFTVRAAVRNPAKLASVSGIEAVGFETAAVAAEPRRHENGWWVATVLPRALRFKKPLHRCNACNPIATRRRS